MGATCSIGIAPPVMGKKKAGSIGVAAAGVDVKLIAPETGEDVICLGLADDHLGEMLKA